ncbi:hypothetical protein AX14_009527 [Amanita brunnescens Koide BX004]|nr:hypothetical protein AX14_009527 [Amanita brunnescens Koide BX004]
MSSAQAAMIFFAFLFGAIQDDRFIGYGPDPSSHSKASLRNSALVGRGHRFRGIRLLFALAPSPAQVTTPKRSRLQRTQQESHFRSQRKSELISRLLPLTLLRRPETVPCDGQDFPGKP